jgi:hypothetical protein
MMANVRISVTVVDAQWPALKIITECQGKIRESRAAYDIAGTQFEPLVKDALREAVEAVVRSHKGGGRQ